MKKSLSLPLLFLVAFVLGGLLFNRGFSMGQVMTLSSSSSASLVCVYCKERDILYRINESDLIGRDFDDSILTHANFTNLDVHGSSFVHSVLAGAVFTGADGNNVDFTDANLSGSNLNFGADFTNAIFVRTDLTGSSNDGGAIFDNANFTDANLSDAYFNGSDLSTATLTGVIWNNTYCPDETNSNENGNTCIGHLVP